jgi:hypothetical protein
VYIILCDQGMQVRGVCVCVCAGQWCEAHVMCVGAGQWFEARVVL